jgi:hypothetical protein
MPNGEVYKKIFDNRNFWFLTYSFLRIDSATGCVYRYRPDGNYTNDELLTDSLNMMMGDSFYDEVGYGILCILVDTIDLFGKTRLQKHFQYSSLYEGMDYNYVEGIGETYRLNYFEHIVALLFRSEITYTKINGEEFGQLVSVDNEKTEKHTYLISQNYPNPFNPTTKIKYIITQLSFVTVKVFDLLGKEVETLVNEEKLEGSYEVEFDAEGLSSGVYIYQLKAGSFVENKKMLLMK